MNPTRWPPPTSENHPDEFFISELGIDCEVISNYITCYLENCAGVRTPSGQIQSTIPRYICKISSLIPYIGPQYG